MPTEDQEVTPDVRRKVIAILAGVAIIFVFGLLAVELKVFRNPSTPIGTRLLEGFAALVVALMVLVFVLKQFGFSAHYYGEVCPNYFDDEESPIG